MSLVKAQVILEHDSAASEDQVVNTFHFDAVPTGTAGNAIALAIVDFYNGAKSTGDAIATFLSPGLDTSAGAAHIKFYDASSTPMGAPFLDVTWTLAPPFGSAGPVPEEVALCLSYERLIIPGGIAARRRGRIYIGPFNTTVLGADSGVSRPAPSLVTTMLDAAEDLQAAVQALGYEWVVFSRAANTYYALERAWVNNAWDTQRRRGIEESSRTYRTI